MSAMEAFPRRWVAPPTARKSEDLDQELVQRTHRERCWTLKAAMAATAD
jgi:hypothetical protein